MSQEKRIDTKPQLAKWSIVDFGFTTLTILFFYKYDICMCQNVTAYFYQKQNMKSFFSLITEHLVFEKCIKIMIKEQIKLELDI